MIVQTVHCAREHGIPLPEPDAANKVNTSGVNLNVAGRQDTINACYHKVVKEAALGR